MKLTDEQLQQLRTSPVDDVRATYIKRVQQERAQINAVIDELLAARRVIEIANRTYTYPPEGEELTAALHDYDKVVK